MEAAERAGGIGIGGGCVGCVRFTMVRGRRRRRFSSAPTNRRVENASSGCVGGGDARVSDCRYLQRPPVDPNVMNQGCVISVRISRNIRHRDRAPH